LSSARQLAQVAYPDVQLLIIRDGISSTDELKQIEQFARAGGRVLLDRPSHELMNALCQQLKLPYRVRPYLGPTVRANGKDQLVEAIAREDLYWLGKHVGRPWSPTPLANNVADGVLMRDAPTKPLAVYEAEQMQLRGSIVQRHHDHVGLFTTGAVEGTIRIPRDGIYVIAITGWGTPLDGIYPLAGIFIDNARVGQLSMSSDKPATFTIEVPLERGEHQLRIGFLNDASRPPQDRNMFVDKIAIGYVGERSDVVFITSPPSVVKIPVGDGAIVLNMLRWDEPPKNKNWIKAQRFILSLLMALGGKFTGGIAYDILEAEWMTPQEGMPWFRREAGYAYMGSNGYIEAKVEIAQPGRYTFKVVARGTQAGGEYPILKLTLDDRTLGEIKLRSDDWALYPLRVSLPKGVHRLRIHFTNDLYQPPEDRNVMIDKLLVVRDTQY
ncbi:MAG TPA: hypothetical protein EYP10_12235, partial [Armatimonadetes bacterium]|nr:hypothetical protein [Armatimonadota bacterium]